MMEPRHIGPRNVPYGAMAQCRQDIKASKAFVLSSGAALQPGVRMFIEKHLQKVAHRLGGTRLIS